MRREKRQVSRNVVMSLMYQVSNIASGFFIPRFILYYYGSEINGLILSISQFITYISMVEIGLSQASLLTLYKPLNNMDCDEVNRTLSGISNYYYRITMYYIVADVGIVIVYPIISNQTLNSSFIRWMVIILSIQYIIDYLGMAKYKVLLIADQKTYLVAAIQTCTTIVYIITSCLCCYLKLPVLVVKLMAPFTYYTRFIVMRKYVKMHYPWVSIDKQVKRLESIKQRGAILLHQLTGLVVNSTDITILTVMGCDMREISVYAVYNMVLNAINSLLYSLFDGVLPTFGSAIVVGQRKRFEKILYEYCLIYYTLAYIFFSCVYQMMDSFVGLYTNGINDVVYIRKNYAALFTLIGLINAMKSPYILVISAGGYFEETKIDTVIEAVINIVVSICLCFYKGVEGVLVGTIVAHLYRLIRLIYVFCRNELNVDIWPFIKMLSVYNCIFILSNQLIRSFFKEHGNLTWLMWVKRGVAVFLVASIMYGFATFMTNKSIMIKYYYKCRNKIKQKTEKGFEKE